MTAPVAFTNAQQLHEAIVAALACGQASCKCARGGVSHCPAHADHNPSLSVSLKGQNVLLHCHGGCTQEAVIEALRERQLWPEHHGQGRSTNGYSAPPRPQRPATYKGQPFLTWYDYRREDGRIAYIVGRTGAKDFPVFHPARGGGWNMGYGAGKRTLYHLPELLAADPDTPVLLPEGEKDVETAEAQGFLATTTPGGAANPHHCDLEALRGRPVVIIPDKDAAGAVFANSLVRLLLPMAASVQVLELPERAAKDLTDYFDSGGRPGVLRILISHAPVVTEPPAEPVSNASAQGDGGWADVLAKHAATMVAWPAFWVKEHQEEDWLLEPLLPRGRSVAIFSPAKVGKSELALYISACLATGRRVLDKAAGPPLDVLYFDLEMTEDDLRERLEEMGFGPESDLSHLHYDLLPNLPPLDSPEGGEEVLLLAQAYNAALVVIDTTSRVLDGSENDADTLRNFHLHTGMLLKAKGVTVLRLDHAGKVLLQGQRGTSAKNDDVDLVWELTVREAGGRRLRATHRRQSWVPQFVDLVRIDDPELRHELAVESWPAGTVEMVQTLDELKVPLDFGGKRVRKLLRSEGRKFRDDVLAAALRYRKQRLGGVPKESGTPPLWPEGTPNGNTPPDRYGNTPRNTSEHPAGAEGGVVPSLRGNTPAEPVCPVCLEPMEPGFVCHPRCVPEYERRQHEAGSPMGEREPESTIVDSDADDDIGLCTRCRQAQADRYDPEGNAVCAQCWVKSEVVR